MRVFLIILWILCMFDVRINGQDIPIHGIAALLGLILFCTNF